MERQGSVITIESVPSTNAYMGANASRFNHGDALLAVEQTAGRGQRGNSWEAEPGMNVTMSVMLRHESLSARSQFIVSEAVAMAVAGVLVRHLGADSGVSVKWPNDIYVGDKKICGILIENVLSGTSLSRSIAGIGLNVNQTLFLSSAPNPVSMRGITGQLYDVAKIAGEVTAELVDLYDRHIAGNDFEPLHRRYMDMLWRRDGYHPYIDTATGSGFLARIAGVELTGHIRLLTEKGEERVYAFKEVMARL